MAKKFKLDPNPRPGNLLPGLTGPGFNPGPLPDPNKYRKPRNPLQRFVLPGSGGGVPGGGGGGGYQPPWQDYIPEEDNWPEKPPWFPTPSFKPMHPNRPGNRNPMYQFDWGPFNF